MDDPSLAEGRPKVAGAEERVKLALDRLRKETKKEPIFRDVHSIWIPNKAPGDRWRKHFG